MKSDAKRYKLPYPVLIGRDSDIVKNYKITKLPKIIIIDHEGKIALYEKFAPAERLQEVLDPLLEKISSE